VTPGLQAPGEEEGQIEAGALAPPLRQIDEHGLGGLSPVRPQELDGGGASADHRVERRADRRLLLDLHPALRRATGAGG